MNNYFIPIIGTISAGKTTFFNSLLGLDILETVWRQRVRK